MKFNTFEKADTRKNRNYSIDTSFTGKRIDKKLCLF